MPEASLPVAGGAYTLGICTNHIALTVVIASCSCRPWMGNEAHTQSISMTVLVMDSCNWSWCAMVCNGLQRFGACAVRERSQDGPLTSIDIPSRIEGLHCPIVNRRKRRRQGIFLQIFEGYSLPIGAPAPVAQMESEVGSSLQQS